MAIIANKVIKEQMFNVDVVISTSKEINQVVQSFNNYNVYISRGTTAIEIRKLTNGIVVAIKPTIVEFMVAIQKLLDLGARKIAFIGDSELIGHKSIDFNIDNVEVSFRPCESALIKENLSNMSAIGVNGFIGGKTLCEMANEMGIHAVILESDEESVKNSILEAVSI